MGCIVLFIAARACVSTFFVAFFRRESDWSSLPGQNASNRALPCTAYLEDLLMGVEFLDCGGRLSTALRAGPPFSWDVSSGGGRPEGGPFQRTEPAQIREVFLPFN